MINTGSGSGTGVFVCVGNCHEGCSIMVFDETPADGFCYTVAKLQTE